MHLHKLCKLFSMGKNNQTKVLFLERVALTFCSVTVSLCSGFPGLLSTELPPGKPSVSPSLEPRGLRKWPTCLRLSSKLGFLLSPPRFSSSTPGFYLLSVSWPLCISHFWQPSKYWNHFVAKNLLWSLQFSSLDWSLLPEPDGINAPDSALISLNELPSCISSCVYVAPSDPAITAFSSHNWCCSLSPHRFSFNYLHFPLPYISVLFSAYIGDLPTCCLPHSILWVVLQFLAIQRILPQLSTLSRPYFKIQVLSIFLKNNQNK